VVLAAVLTWIIPGGSFERQVVNVNGIDRNVVAPGSFVYTGSNPQTWQVFSALFEGFVDKADIIIFILIIGGAFWIMNSSNAIDYTIASSFHQKAGEEQADKEDRRPQCYFYNNNALIQHLRGGIRDE
jgi:uncharacterized ion transporter superfamily protein YfcC